MLYQLVLFRTSLRGSAAKTSCATPREGFQENLRGFSRWKSQSGEIMSFLWNLGNWMGEMVDAQSIFCDDRWEFRLPKTQDSLTMTHHQRMILRPKVQDYHRCDTSHSRPHSHHAAFTCPLTSLRIHGSLTNMGHEPDRHKQYSQMSTSTSSRLQLHKLRLPPPRRFAPRRIQGSPFEQRFSR